MCRSGEGRWPGVALENKRPSRISAISGAVRLLVHRLRANGTRQDPVDDVNTFHPKCNMSSLTRLEQGVILVLEQSILFSRKLRPSLITSVWHVGISPYIEQML